MPTASSAPASRNEIHQNHDDRDHEQDMDKRTDRVGGDDSEEPENDQNNGNCIEHKNESVEFIGSIHAIPYPGNGVLPYRLTMGIVGRTHW